MPLAVLFGKLLARRTWKVISLTKSGNIVSPVRKPATENSPAFHASCRNPSKVQ